MNEQKLAGMIGFAVRCRQAAAGTDACRIMIRSGKCGVLLVDEETAPNTRKRAEELCGPENVPIIILKAGLIEQASGKGCRIMGVQKGSFSEQILKLNNG